MKKKKSQITNHKSKSKKKVLIPHCPPERRESSRRTEAERNVIDAFLPISNTLKVGNWWCLPSIKSYSVFFGGPIWARILTVPVLGTVPYWLNNNIGAISGSVRYWLIVVVRSALTQLGSDIHHHHHHHWHRNSNTWDSCTKAYCL